jgi:hypothetical protein
VIKSLGELARSEGVDSSCVRRMDNPASAIVAAVLNETLPADLTPFDLAVDPDAVRGASERN